METISDNSNDGKAIPKNDKLIGTLNINNGELPRTKSTASFVTLIGGYIATFIGSGLVSDTVSSAFKEDVSKYATNETGTLLSAALKGLRQSIDLKLWKSTLAHAATFVGGVFATDYAVKKVEEHTFKKRYGTLPHMDQLTQLVKDTEQNTPTQVTATQDKAPGQNWQDKTKKPEEPQTSAAR